MGKSVIKIMPMPGWARTLSRASDGLQIAIKVYQRLCEKTTEIKENSVKNKFFTREFVPVAQSSQVMERTWLLRWKMKRQSLK